MIALIKILIFGHLHKWNVVKEAPFVDYTRELSGSDRVTQRGTQYDCKCEKCGSMKAFKL